MNVLEKILEEIEEKFKTADAEKCDCEELCDVEDWYDSGYIDGQLSAHEKCMDIIRSHMNEVENDERLIKKYVTNRQVVRDLYKKYLYIKGCCPKCGCELKSCETDYCRACGQALIWENPEGGL